MVIESGLQQRDVVADYWQAYFEWRAIYGLSDTCMGELLAALRVEVEGAEHDPLQKARLAALSRMIEVELCSDAHARLVA